MSWQKTIHLLEQKETIHMISMLRKEACSGLAHIPTQNCLADCLTKATVKAYNLTTAVKTGKLLQVDIHHNFKTPMEHKAFFLHGSGLFCTTEKDVFF